MLRGIWAFFVLALATVFFGLPVVLLAPLFPRWTAFPTLMARGWSRVMLRAVGARMTYHDPHGALLQSRCIFIANHQSNVDIWVLGKVMPIGTRFVAKQELFRIPVLGRAMTAAGFIRINRSNRSEAIRSLTQAAESIRNGRPVILFPEGTRSRDGRLQPFKKGAFHLATLAGVPVVPVAIRGTFEIMPPKSVRVRPGTVDVFFERAIDLAGFESNRPGELLDVVHAAIAGRLDRIPGALTRRELAALLARRVARDPLAREIRDLARSSAVPAWLVGGFVRDAALGRRSRDLDFSVGPGAPRFIVALERALETRGFRFHKRGVTTWRFHARGRQVDVVDAGRRGIGKDLSRRELTINAVAFHLVDESIFDPLRGLADLRAHRLRLPRSGVVAEDPVRALRAARFLAELPEFTLHDSARAEARSVAQRLRRAAVERVREELDKLLAAAAPRRGLLELQQLGLLDPLLPELKAMRTCAGGSDRPDVWTHTLDCLAVSSRPFRLPASYVVKDAVSRRILCWALLLHDISKPDTLRYLPTGAPSFHGHEVLGARRAESLLARLRMPRTDRRRIGKLVLNHLRPGHLADAGIPARGMRRLVRDAGDDLPLLVLHAACDARASGGPPDRERWRRLRTTLHRLVEIAKKRARKPLPRLLDGNLLLETLGLDPGPRIGRILREVRDAQEAGGVRTREEALRLARRLARERA